MGFLGRFMSSVVVPVVVGILAYRYGHLVVDRLDWEPIEVFCRERIGIKIFDLSKEESVATQKDEGKGPKEKIIIEDQGKVVVLDKKKIMEEKEEAEKKAKAAEREQEDAAKVADKREEDKDHEDGVKKAKKTYRKGDPRNCCHKLRIEGTKIDDPWYRNIMGEYTFFPELRFIEYEKHGKLSGKYPVYWHEFWNFTRTKERPELPRSFLYYYINEEPNYPEVECKEKGCWIISLYDPSPGNYWFGKKWYYILSPGTPPKCPDKLTEGKGKPFVNDKGEREENLKITCIDDE